MKAVPCPFCKNTNSSLFAIENQCQLKKCNDCGFLYVSPRPFDNDISEATKIGLHGTKTDRMEKVKSLKKISLIHALRINSVRKRLKEFLKEEGLKEKEKLKWLDVGTGYGELLLALKDLTHKNSTLKGIEPSKPKLELAHYYRLNVSDTPLKAINDRYDYISLINVFSHLPEPIEFIVEMKRLLRPGGKLLIVTGNAADILKEDYPGLFNIPDHLVFAGERHIHKLCEEMRCSIVKFNKYKSSFPENRLVKVLKKFLYGSGASNKGEFRSMWLLAKMK